MMKVLDYYFILEFQWREDWVSNVGIAKPIIRPSNMFIQKHGFIDYSILEGIILYDKAFKTFKNSESLIHDLKKNLAEKSEIHLGNEIVGLDMKPDFCRPIDNLGDNQGIEASLSWNITTPEKLQYIPTVEVFSLFEDWKKFLKTLEAKPIDPRQ